MTGYADIDQSFEIISGKTSDNTMMLHGDKRATNSVNWVLLALTGQESFFTTYGGDSGDLLTIEHDAGENLKGLNGWYKASLIRTFFSSTHTSLGKCLIN